MGLRVSFFRLRFQDRQIALHYAAANGHSEVVKVLVHQDGNQLTSLAKSYTNAYKGVTKRESKEAELTNDFFWGMRFIKYL